MKHLIHFIFLLIFIVCPEVSAKKVTYTYDNAGNRIKREIVLSPKGKASQENAHEMQSVSDMMADKNIRIHPNPTTGMLRVEIINYESDDLGNIYVYSINGNTITQSKISSQLTDIDISSSPNGIYLLNIQLNGTSITWRVIKQ
ncbi:MAG: T9SS type A sorting domain-containing protein [Muribaculaceae bacterium]|nr:T9SS type A sorting domain-containing protein [Muribaculaceae bacterium]MDE6632656.1 T9SS type A sorting domain-containing protein [Muribaculaceae bacterium]